VESLPSRAVPCRELATQACTGGGAALRLCAVWGGWVSGVVGNQARGPVSVFTPGSPCAAQMRFHDVEEGSCAAAARVNAFAGTAHAMRHGIGR